MPHCRPSHHGKSCFNPLPPTVGGRIFLVFDDSCRVNVSIRSRRLSAGECQVTSLVSIRIYVSIRSRRLSAGESAATVSACRWLTFQSAPADCRRENCDFRRAASRSGGFNPLPPTVGGRIVATMPDGSKETVSIRSRRLSAGESAGSLQPILSRTFQSAPADCRRENEEEPPMLTIIVRFNPLPPTVGGRMPNTTAAIPVLVGFNPLPPTVGGRMPKRFPTNPLPLRFNPLPPTVGGRMGGIEPPTYRL